MHVGILLDDIHPDTGGGFTFMHDVVSAFLDCATQTGHRFTLFCPPDYATHLRTNLPANTAVKPIHARGLVARLVARLRHTSPSLAIHLHRWCSLERLARSLGVEVMWFVGGGMYDTLDMPYFTTIWDLQHRTHPWFPEVSSGGDWESREAFLARHVRRAACIITGTRVGQRQLEEFYGAASERVRVLPHPTPAFALNAPPYAAGSGFHGQQKDYFYYPAQFWAHKNHTNLLRGYALLKANRADAPDLVLSGSDKGNLTHIKRLAAELGLSESVHFLGFVSLQDVIALYRNARALVYPSFSGPENLPPLEAFALGCPVLVSEYPGAREQLEDAAIYFDPVRPAIISAALSAILDDAPLRDRLVMAGRERAARWTGRDFVRGVFAAFDDFEPIRRSWGA